MSSSKQSRKHRKSAVLPTTTSSSQVTSSSSTTTSNTAFAASASASPTSTDSRVHLSTDDVYAVGEMDIEPSNSQGIPVPVVSQVYDSTTMTRCPHCKKTRNWEVTRDHIPNCPKKPLLLKQLGVTMPPAGHHMSGHPNAYEDTTRFRDVGTYVSGTRYLSNQLPSQGGYSDGIHHQSFSGQVPGGQGSSSQTSLGTSAGNGWYGRNPVASGGYMEPGMPQAHQPVGLPYARQLHGAPYTQQPPGAPYAQPSPNFPYAQQPGLPYAQQQPIYPYTSQSGVPYTQQTPGTTSFMYPYMPMPMNNQTNPSEDEAYRRRGRKPDRQW